MSRKVYDCSLCRTTHFDLPRHEAGLPHRLRVRKAEMAARGWARASGYAGFIISTDAPCERAPSAVPGRRNALKGTDEDFIQSTWAPMWAVRVAKISGPAAVVRRFWVDSLVRYPGNRMALEALIRMGAVEQDIVQFLLDSFGMGKKRAPTRAARHDVE